MPNCIDFFAKNDKITNYKKGRFFMEKNKLINNSTIIKTAISNYAFINREDLTDFILPDNIKSIEERASTFIRHF